MEQHKRNKKVLKFNSITNCGNRAGCWPRIKISSSCIGYIPKYNPIDSITPTINRYFYIPTSDIDLTNGVTIPSNLFLNDDGNKTTHFSIFSPSGYVNLYVNGVMQEGGLYTVNTNSLIIIPTASKISESNSIIIESVGFSYE